MWMNCTPPLAWGTSCMPISDSYSLIDRQREWRSWTDPASQSTKVTREIGANLARVSKAIAKEGTDRLSGLAEPLPSKPPFRKGLESQSRNPQLSARTMPVMLRRLTIGAPFTALLTSIKDASGRAQRASNNNARSSRLISHRVSDGSISVT
jgi:hypothetical protein